MTGYNKYACVLHREIRIEDETVVKLCKILNKGISLSLGDKTLALYSLSGVFPELEDLIRVVDYDTEIFLGIVEAHSESEANMIAKSKFNEIINSHPPYLYDSYLEVKDIDSITY